MLHWSHDPCPQTGDTSEYLLRFKNKKDLSERDICSKFIGPAVKRAGWDGMMQIREEVAFTKGRIIVRGKLVTHGKAKRADYILYYKPTPVTLEISVRRPGWLETASKSGFKRISSPIWLGKSPGIKISGARFLGKFLGKL